MRVVTTLNITPAHFAYGFENIDREECNDLHPFPCANAVVMLSEVGGLFPLMLMMDGADLTPTHVEADEETEIVYHMDFESDSGIIIRLMNDSEEAMA